MANHTTSEQNSFKKVSGNAPGVVSAKSSNSSPSAAMQQKHRLTTSSITYPINVESDSMQGHYIMFMINEAKNATLHAMKSGETAKSVAKKLRQQEQAANIGEAGPSILDSISARQIENFRPRDQVKGQGSPTRSLALKNHSTTLLKTAISLYMPPSVSVSYGMNYADKEVGVTAETGSNAINTILNNKDIASTVSQLGKDAGKAAWQGAKIAGIAAIDMIAPGASTVIALQRGAIITPRMEIMLEGVSRRSFSYTFIFIPKSAQEAKIVEDIIYAFKFHMHPEYFDSQLFGASVGVGREMTIPSTFDIAYMYQNGPNNFLNKISTCFLKTMDVQYGAERFTAYEPTEGNFGSGPPPQRTQITLNFSEMEIITKERIAEGY